MANLLGNGMFGLILLGAGSLAVGEEASVLLRESAQPNEATRVLVTLKAEGLYQPAPAPGLAKDEPVKPLALKVETRFDFGERVIKLDDKGQARRAVRRVVQAASAINGEIRAAGAVLRPEVALLVAEPRDKGVVVFSPGGPLTRSELEVVQGAGDPLLLSRLLPGKAVAKGEHWRVSDDAARCLSGYDALAVNSLQATLETVNADTAKIRLSGEVRGAVLGGEGAINCEGLCIFDRKSEKIVEMTVKRAEVRKPGPVEAGLDLKSTLSVTRRAIAVPKALSDAVISAVPTDPTPLREQLLLIPPSGKYSLLHDRSWHVYWDDPRQSVLKRLDQGVVVAQCNLAIGPNAGKGRHQNLEQFRGDLRRALGSRFVEFLGEGEVDGDPAGGFRYKVGAQGREGEVGVIWYYFLVASPEGEQLLAMFTLAQDHLKSFGGQDSIMIGSFKWKEKDAEDATPKATNSGGGKTEGEKKD